MLLILCLVNEDWLLMIAAFSTSCRSLADKVVFFFHLDAGAQSRCDDFHTPARGCGSNSFGNRLIAVISARSPQSAHVRVCSFPPFLLRPPNPPLQFLWATSTSRAPAPSSGSGGRLRCTALSWCRRTWAAGPWTNTTPSTFAAVRGACLRVKCFSSTV